MINCLKYDFYKLFRRKAFYICGLILMALSFINSFIPYYIYNNVFTDPKDKVSIAPSILENSGSILLFIAIIVSVFVASEFSFGTIKNIITKNISRTKVYFSKLITCSAISLIYLLVSFITRFILVFVLDDKFVLDSKMFLQIIRMVGLEALVCVSVTSIFLMVAMLLRNNGSVISVNLIIIMLTSLLLEFINLFFIRTLKFKDFHAEKYCVTEYIQSFSKLNIEMNVITTGIIVSLVFLILTTTIGVYTFNKRDIK